MFSCAQCSCHNNEGSVSCSVCGFEFKTSNNANNNSSVGAGSMESMEVLTVTDGVMECLNVVLSNTHSGYLDRQKLCFKLCSMIPHVSQRNGFGSRYACGYRNVQMLSCALMQIPQYKACLFDGSGRIPDVPGLQRWIEAAWAAGYDPEGCAQLGGRLQGTQQWIGATECWALFRSFGVRAEIVDFQYRIPPPRPAPKREDQNKGKGRGSKRPLMAKDEDNETAEAVNSAVKAPTALGLALNSWFRGDYCEGLQQDWIAWLQANGDSDSGSRAYSSNGNNGSNVNNVAACNAIVDLTGDDDTENDKGFIGTAGGGSCSCRSSGAAKAGMTAPATPIKQFLPPVFLQHQGHSRTLVGYSGIHLADPSINANIPIPSAEVLYVLDPGHDGRRLLQSLREAVRTRHQPYPTTKWMKNLRLELGSFRRDAYQAVFIAPGLLTAEESRVDNKFCNKSRKIIV